MIHVWTRNDKVLQYLFTTAVWGSAMGSYAAFEFKEDGTLRNLLGKSNDDFDEQDDCAVAPESCQVFKL